MKKLTLTILSLLGLSSTVQADIDLANSLTSDEAQGISSALIFLKDKKVLIKDKDGKFDIDKDVLQKLKDEGKIKPKRPSVQTICGGHT